MCRSPLSSAAVAAAAIAAATAVPAAAQAGEIEVDRRCYEESTPVNVRALEFPPRTPLTITLDGTVLRHRDGTLPSTNSVGLFENRFSAPTVGGDSSRVLQRRVALDATDGTSSASTSFWVSRPTGGDFQPSKGDPRTLAVRFRVWGFALGDAPNRRVHLHWIAPDGEVREDAVLGRSSGPCGTLTTGRKRIFPFAAESGRWTLVLDTHPRYRARAEGPSVRIPVRIKEMSA